jgi:hypothetical protein
MTFNVGVAITITPSSPGLPSATQCCDWGGLLLTSLKALSAMTTPRNEETVRRTEYEWEKPAWTKPKLRPTEKRQVIEEGGDLQGPITRVNDEKVRMDDINFEASPMILRRTARGSTARMGENLAGPVTFVVRDPMSDINFEASPELVLKSTEQGKVVNQGENLAKPITFPKKATSGANFVANPSLLKTTNNGVAMKTKGDLQGPITLVNAEKERLDDINFEANPLILRPTTKGSAARMGENLELPVTHIKKHIERVL